MIEKEKIISLVKKAIDGGNYTITSRVVRYDDGDRNILSFNVGDLQIGDCPVIVFPSHIEGHWDEQFYHPQGDFRTELMEILNPLFLKKHDTLKTKKEEAESRKLSKVVDYLDGVLK